MDRYREYCPWVQCFGLVPDVSEPLRGHQQPIATSLRTSASPLIAAELCEPGRGIVGVQK